MVTDKRDVGIFVSPSWIGLLAGVGPKKESTCQSAMMMKTMLVFWLACSGIMGVHAAERLQPGDAVSLVFSIKEDGLDGIYTVNKDGAVNLPLIGKVMVAGRSAEEGCELIRRRYIEDGIYTRLSVGLSSQKLTLVPHPNGRGYIRMPMPTPSKPLGDFYTPQERMKVFPIPQLDVRNRRVPE